MAGIDLMGSDPWGSIVQGDDKIGDILGGGSIAGLDPTGGWLSLGVKLLSGKSEVSGAAGNADSLLNTSGFVVGEGDAEGGTLSSERIAALPWYAWAAGALVAIAIIKRAV